MNPQRIPAWIKATGVGAITAVVAWIYITTALDRQGQALSPDSRGEISADLKDFLLIMKEEEDVALIRSLPIR